MTSIELEEDIIIQRENTSDSFNDESGELQLLNTQKKKRIEWIDALRGFAVFWWILLFFAPKEYDNPVVLFILQHAPGESPYMTLHDIGAPGFLFVMGLSMPLSFQSRVKQKGYLNLYLH